MRFSLLCLSLCLIHPGPLSARVPTPTAAAETLRLYKTPLPTATPVSLSVSAVPWDLRILVPPPKIIRAGLVTIRVMVLRQAKDAEDGLLLTVNARSADGKSVDRKQAQPHFGAGQTSYAVDLEIDSPDCRPVKVVAALFKDKALEPLARFEKKLSFECGND